MNTEEILKVENPFKQSFYDWMNSLADIKDRDRMMMEVAVNWAVRNLTASQSEQGYSEAFWEEIRERFRDHAKEHLHFTECDGRYKAGYSDAVDFSFEWFKSSLPHRGYNEAEVKELLDKQKRLCAEYLEYSYSQHPLVLDQMVSYAPEPQLKDQNVQECDATKAQQSGEAGSQNWKELFIEAFCLRKPNGLDITDEVIKYLDDNVVSPLQRELREAREEIERLEDTGDNLKHLMANVEQRGYSKALQEVADLGLKNLSQQPQWVRASERLPSVGIYHALYNGDHILFQVHDGGFRAIFYDGSLFDVPKLNILKWLDESTPQPSEAQDKENI
jgi:hypothetical protein